MCVYMSVPTLHDWRWEPSGALTGRVYGKCGYRDGTLLTTSVVPPKGRSERTVRTVSGTAYSLGAPADAVAEDEARTREAAKRQSAPYPVMAPPIIWHRKSGKELFINQLPAIIRYPIPHRGWITARAPNRVNS